MCVCVCATQGSVLMCVHVSAWVCYTGISTDVCVCVLHRDQCVGTVRGRVKVGRTQAVLK